MKIKIIFFIIYLFIKDEIKNFISVCFLITLNTTRNKKFGDEKFDFFTKFQKHSDNKKKILITTFLGIYDYLKYEYLIAIYLSNIKKQSIVVLLEEKDYFTKNFFLKKGISNFIYYKKRANFIKRIEYVVRAYNLINNIKSIRNFVNFKYEGLPTGKIIYSHVSRFTRTPTFEKVEYKFYNTLASYLHYASEFKNILKGNKFEYFMQAETQFIPPAIFMGYGLKKKIMMVSRIGNNKLISIRLTNNLKHFNESRWKFSSELFKRLKKTHKNKAIKKAKKILVDRFVGKNNPDKEIDLEMIKLSKIKKIKIFEKFNKNFLCKKFNWNIQKPIGVIFANDLTDGLFTVKSGIYRDNYIWLEKVLKFISLNKNINWIVKSHPSDLKNNGKLKTKDLFFSKKRPDHVKFYPENWGRKNLYKIVDIVFTNYGTAGYEYPSMGIPSVISSEAHYSGLKIAYETRTEKELYKTIINSHKIKKLSKLYKDNAQIFCYLENIYTKVKLELATVDEYKSFGQSKNYWKKYKRTFKSSNVYKYNSLKNDVFYKSFKYQIDKKLKHTINLKII